MAAKLPRIAVLGSLNMDLVSYVPHHPLPGETLTATSFAVSPGGKGANQAVACAKLSRSRADASSSSSSAHASTATASVAMIGSVGTDTYGTTLRENLAAHGVDAERVSALEGRKTGVAIIIVDEPSGQNRIVLSPEANHALQPEDVSPAPALIRTLGGAAADLLIMQLEIPLQTVLAALRSAREAGVPVLLNPAPAVTLPADALRGLAHLVVNETEAAILGECEESVLDSEEGMEKVASGFIEKGVANVIITLGGRGVYYMNKAGEKGLLPAQKAKVVDTTAAGDTFVGQYALEAVSSKFDIVAAVNKSNRAAAKTVERQGAQVSIPWRDELL